MEREKEGREEACAEWKRVHFGHGRRDDLILGLGLWIDGRVDSFGFCEIACARCVLDAW